MCQRGHQMTRGSLPRSTTRGKNLLWLTLSAIDIAHLEELDRQWRYLLKVLYAAWIHPHQQQILPIGCAMLRLETEQLQSHTLELGIGRDRKYFIRKIHL